MSCLGKACALWLLNKFVFAEHPQHVCLLLHLFDHFHVPSSLIWAAWAAWECVGSSPPIVKCLAWKRLTNQPLQHFMFELATSFTNKHKCVCVCGCTHSSFTASAARSCERLGLWLILSLLCWYQRGGTECKKDDWRQECFEREHYSVSFLNIRLGPGWDFWSYVGPHPVQFLIWYFFSFLTRLSSSYLFFFFLEGWGGWVALIAVVM